jgi:hypothetical protein
MTTMILQQRIRSGCDSPGRDPTARSADAPSRPGDLAPAKERTIKGPFIFWRSERELAETIAYASLGIAGVVMIGFAALSIWNLLAGPRQAGATSSVRELIAAPCEAAPVAFTLPGLPTVGGSGH